MRAATGAVLIVALGCGASHERDGDADAGPRPVDAGARDAGHDVDSCEEAFDASPGASCPEWLECGLGD